MSDELARVLDHAGEAGVELRDAAIAYAGSPPIIIAAAGIVLERAAIRYAEALAELRRLEPLALRTVTTGCEDRGSDDEPAARRTNRNGDERE